ncbi:class I SAM-dependent methyltransferase [Nakamurella endophytica]|uniref:Methyltransferase n=1 Tax=Nakamurella endophytica TaxID=1748367 RepID=A0A917T3U1_9ACTN|nr:class I SAM-dependent methyltransferase [Nakamurella endophytica]GGM08130.1 methyltransferase [Nakamurella endophytica]
MTDPAAPSPRSAAPSTDPVPPTHGVPAPTDPAALAPGGTEEQAWDRRYLEREQVWSGQPNGALVAEVAGLPPGRVLDVGCGEGADAVWLAARGWDVTGLEVSGVALARAAEHAERAGVSVRWVHSGLVDAGLPAKAFDLVSALYPALLRAPDRAAERALIDAVAPGGRLLVVHHAGIEDQEPHDGFDPADYVSPRMVAELLDDGWAVEVDERRARVVPQGGGGAHHTEDLVLHARRLA